MIQSLSEYTDKYIHVIQSLLENGVVKSYLAIGGTVVFGVVQSIFNLLSTDLVLVVGLVMLITLDILSGCLNAYTSGRKLTSLGFRSTGVKIIEYFIILGAFTILSNMNEMMSWVQVWAFMFVAITEIWSIGENMYSPKVQRLVKVFAERMKNEQGIDVTDEE